jgi:hypothetical protein
MVAVLITLTGVKYKRQSCEGILIRECTVFVQENSLIIYGSDLFEMSQIHWAD